MEIFGSYCEYCCNGVVILWYFFIEGKHVQCSFFFFRFVLKYPYPFPKLWTRSIRIHDLVPIPRWPVPIPVPTGSVSVCPGLLTRLELDYVLHSTPTEVCGPCRAIRTTYAQHWKNKANFALCGLNDPVQKKWTGDLFKTLGKLFSKLKNETEVVSPSFCSHYMSTCR